MNVIEGKKIEGTVLQIDDTFFKDCTVAHCELVYSGGEVKWEHTTWRDCSITLTGQANIVMQVLRGLGFNVTPPSQGRQIERPIH